MAAPAISVEVFFPLSPMPKPRPNPTRETRIEMEIVVDAHDEDERAMGWHCYLDDNLKFPFRARCADARKISPLKKAKKSRSSAWRLRMTAYARCGC